MIQSKELEAGPARCVAIWENIAKGEECRPHDVLPGRSVTVQVYGELDGAKVELRGTIVPDVPLSILHNRDGDEVCFDEVGIMRVDGSIKGIVPVVLEATDKTNVGVAVLMD